ncbi:hypothetical protein BRW65_26835 [Mycobacterium paraffinicum]|uniref:Uncharacterized protein n=1 Tax=Mycobacterium paraffinicum TaxID=53378 RepID=A0A1Q4HGV6_9MYCO|nr:MULTISPECIES: hypothetical protein [Mycobacterium]KEF94848.1 hypothetical protein K883_05272 [Mycobacterium sp. TKK-01-0059]OBJ84181.1 hypothetical protein A9W96_27230 [Mycobacterium sp. 1245852.3]OJZ66758.1 hypothetical protein BRW65_26835 [Mycobacterium paraffinicum]
MSAIDALVQESQDQHRRYYELFGHNPVRGDGLREVGELSRQCAEQAREIRQQVLDSNFSTAVLG